MLASNAKVLVALQIANLVGPALRPIQEVGKIKSSVGGTAATIQDQHSDVSIG
jgi:hypothetical protein